MAATERKSSLIERLFAEHGGALRTFFLRRVRTKTNAADLAQVELDAAQRVLRLGIVLQQLRPKCRAAVELRFTQELTYREIAIHLGISPQMAKKYVAQGLSHCRRRMAQLG
jgi:DNA-directed RNA polymerase specialized sigma24 family protein